MLGVRDVRRVAWRRLHAPQHYLGYLTITDDMIGLSGREEPTGIGVSLSIPCDAVLRMHAGTATEEQLAGEATVVLEVADGVPIILRPVGTDDLGLEALARKLRSAIELNPKAGRARARSARPRPGWTGRASA
jgi:hypothetical protein